MRNFHGQNKQSRFFEGWYLKHEKDGQVLALIPAYHVDEEGRAGASIQIITREGADAVQFPPDAFYAAAERFFVRVGENEFSDLGIRIHLKGKRFSVVGRLRYAPFQRPRYDMMGPFCHLRFMECNHGVLSFSHRLEGTLQINGQSIDFTDGLGYIEKDWGRSFPSSYLWTQSGWAGRGQSSSIMLSVADIPLLGGRFTGCIGAVWHHGREYRLATYRGASVCTCTAREAIVRQGKLCLQALLLESRSHPLRAPVGGGMRRVIHESPACKVAYRFWEKDRLLFDRVGNCAGFEAVFPPAGQPSVLIR